jgi:tungstate transport system permease protein
MARQESQRRRVAAPCQLAEHRGGNQIAGALQGWAVLQLRRVRGKTSAAARVADQEAGMSVRLRAGSRNRHGWSWSQAIRLGPGRRPGCRMMPRAALDSVVYGLSGAVHYPPFAWRGQMSDTSAFGLALSMIWSGDPVLVEIVLLSLQVTLTALVVAALLGLPLGAVLALSRFAGRGVVIVLFSALMGLPPVVAGLAIYLLLSRSGPLGDLGLLFTPAAMITAQTILILPIVASLTRQVVEDMWSEYAEQLRSLGSSVTRAVPTLLWDARYSLVTTLLAGFGRASAEVGAVLIVGGNIAGHTRTMTTAIALETSRGALALALGLGVILLGLTLALNIVAHLAARFDQWRTA